MLGTTKNMLVILHAASISYIFLILDFQLCTSSQGQNFCSSGWHQSPTSYSCIKFYSEEKSWVDARNICQAVNGDLMIKIDDMKQNLIAAQKERFEPEEEFWFGLNDRKNEGHFKWLDGTETASKTYWMDNQPNNYEGVQDCGAYRNPRSNIAKWNDQLCSKRRKFVCEVFPDCPGNTFGERCTDICNQNCDGANNTCKRFDGFCINGCDIGYQGNTCEAPCEDDTFGADCSENCSITCAGPNNNCDHVNGSCIFGCDHGYQGERCENFLGLKRDFSYSMRAVIASSMFLLGIWTCFMMCVAIKYSHSDKSSFEHEKTTFSSSYNHESSLVFGTARSFSNEEHSNFYARFVSQKKDSMPARSIVIRNHSHFSALSRSVEEFYDTETVPVHSYTDISFPVDEIHEGVETFV